MSTSVILQLHGGVEAVQMGFCIFTFTFISCIHLGCILFGMLSRPLFCTFWVQTINRCNLFFSPFLSGDWTYICQLLKAQYAKVLFSLQGFSHLAQQGEQCIRLLIMHCLYDNLGWDALIAWWGSVHHMQFLEGYLHQYKVPRGVRISDPTWKELFSEVVKRWPILYNTWALSTNIDQENFSVKIILQSRPTTKI